MACRFGQWLKTVKYVSTFSGHGLQVKNSAALSVATAIIAYRSICNPKDLCGGGSQWFVSRLNQRTVIPMTRNLLDALFPSPSCWHPPFCSFFETDDSKNLILMESYSIFSFYCLLSLIVLKVHPCGSMWRAFLALHVWVWIILHCMYVPHFLYQFISSWTLGSFHLLAAVIMLL